MFIDHAGYIVFHCINKLFTELMRIIDNGQWASLNKRIELQMKKKFKGMISHSLEIFLERM